MRPLIKPSVNQSPFDYHADSRFCEQVQLTYVTQDTFTRNAHCLAHLGRNSSRLTNPLIRDISHFRSGSGRKECPIRRNALRSSVSNSSGLTI